MEVNGEALKNTDAKIKVYNTAVLPSLRYSTETLILYPRHIKQLTRVQLRQSSTADHEYQMERQNSRRDGPAARSCECGSLDCMTDDRLPKEVFDSASSGWQAEGWWSETVV